MKIEMCIHDVIIMVRSSEFVVWHLWIAGDTPAGDFPLSHLGSLLPHIAFHESPKLKSVGIRWDDLGGRGM
jgi:hypothetical protein